MTVGQRERETQDRIIKLFSEKLDYTFLGSWEERDDNSNIEEELLVKFLKKKYNKSQIERALFILKNAVIVQGNKLYETNEKIYSMLRYGIQVPEKPGKLNITVDLIDKDHPEKKELYKVKKN